MDEKKIRKYVNYQEEKKKKKIINKNLVYFKGLFLKIRAIQIVL